MRLAIENVSQRYDAGNVIEDISFTADTGELVVVLGPNGSGKSTLIKTICNIMRPASGSISIDGTSVRDMGKKEFAKNVSYIPQTPIFFGLTNVYDTVLLGRRPYIEWSYSESDLSIAADAMIRMNVQDFAVKNVSELSGGQMQRVFIARSLAQDPRFYVFDEPTSSLDLNYQLGTMDIMKDVIVERKACVVMALHDLNLTLRYADKVVVIKDKGVYDSGKPRDVITSRMIHDVYGVDADVIDTEKGLFVMSYRSCGW